MKSVGPYLQEVKDERISRFRHLIIESIILYKPGWILKCWRYPKALVRQALQVQVTYRHSVIRQWHSKLFPITGKSPLSSHWNSSWAFRNTEIDLIPPMSSTRKTTKISNNANGVELENLSIYRLQIINGVRLSVRASFKKLYIYPLVFFNDK